MNLLHRHVRDHVKAYSHHYLSGIGVLTFLAVLLISIGYIRNSFAATGGPNDPAVVVEDTSTGTNSWSNYINVATSNDSYANVGLNDFAVSYYIKATDFGFSIPEGAVINGITVEVEKKASNASRIQDYRVRLVKGGVIGTTDRLDPNYRGTSDTYTTHGGTGDLWGETWMPTDINNTGFGVAFSAFKNTFVGGGITASVDHIRITITYTPADTTAPTLTAVHIVSNNATGSYAKVGDNVTLSFTGSEALTGVTVTIAGHSVAPSGGITGWTSSYTMSGSDSEGAIPFTINYRDLAGNTGTQVISATDSSQVIFDKTPPTFSNLISGTTYIGSATIYFSDTNLSGAIISGLDNSYYNGNYASATTITPLGKHIFTVFDKAGNSTGAVFTIAVQDTIAPILAQITAVQNPTNDTTPDYTFSSNEAGTISYSGDCASATTGAISGNNVVAFTTLSEGLFTGCLIRVKDAANNTSIPLSVNTFTIDITPPTASDVIYDITGWTNQDVTATVTGFSETVTGLNASSHLFTANGSFDFTFQDLAGNTGSETATVTWIDKTAPVVTLSGASTMTIYINNIYPEYGATWTDNIDGSGFLAGPTAGSVNTAALGIYTLTYGKTDAVGNYGFIQRTVTITGSTPVVSLNGLNPYTIEFGSGYTEFGATWTDVVDGSGTVTDIVSTVDTDTLGSYTVTYRYVNTSLLTGSAERTVNVVDTTAPVVSINGTGTVYVEYGSAYTEAGALRGDVHDGAGEVTNISGTVNTGVLGTYTLEYIKVDISGNTGNAFRTVIVQDTIAPSVILTALQGSPTNEAVHMTAQFSEAVTGFAAGDLTLGNGSLSGFVKVDGDTYTFDVLPASQGTETVDVTSGVCKDLADRNNIAALQFSIIYDTVAPSITITSHASGQLISSNSATLAGTGVDTNGIATVKVNNVIASGTTSWSKAVSLSGGSNTKTVEATDNAGNTGTALITLIRVPVTSNVSNSFVSSTSQEVIFDTDFSSIGYVKYGIGNFGSGTLGTLGTAHSITLNNLIINTTYIYQAAGVINGYTGEFSATGSFHKSQVVTSSGTTVATGGAVVVSGVFNTGTVILSSGSNTVQIQLSGTYSSLEFVAPTIVIEGNTGTAQFGESGLPASSSNSIVRLILGTHKVGGDVGVAVNAYITFEVSNGTAGQTVLLYRSENGTTRVANTPDASCTLNASLLCSFRTDSLSYFATISESTSSATSAKGGNAVVSQDYCPTYGDLSPSYYDGTCEFHGAPSKWSEEMNMAYLYARNIGLTKSKNIGSANVDADLTRAQMAKMISLYAAKVLGKKVNPSLSCEFTDLKGQSRETKQYIKYACQFGLMGYMADGNKSPVFNPNAKITRADFGTVLSRAIYGNTTYAAHGSAPYYQDHLNALKESNIISDIRPTFQESIGTAMLILMRAAVNR